MNGTSTTFFRNTKRQFFSLTLAQYTLAKRILDGEHLPLSRFRHEHATIAGLLRKNCLTVMHGATTRTKPFWGLTDLCETALANKSKLLPKPVTN